MVNIEIKAHYPDQDKGAAIAERLNGAYQGIDEQIDTYYVVPNGRLKLRQSTLSPDYLVGYNRPDTSTSKASSYALHQVNDPDSLHKILTGNLGVWLQVRKKRTIYLIDNVRVHLDVVEQLGRFLEFEAVLGQGHTEEEGHRQVELLMAEFGVSESDLIQGSYSDLLENMQ